MRRAAVGRGSGLLPNPDPVEKTAGHGSGGGRAYYETPIRSKKRSVLGLGIEQISILVPGNLQRPQHPEFRSGLGHRRYRIEVTTDEMALTPP